MAGRGAWLLALAVMLWGTAALADEARLDPADWRLYLAQYVMPDGRVVDAANGNISHSEGQGYAMVLATAYGDRAAFDRIWHWTRSHLRRPRDHLFAWKFAPARDGHAAAIADSNDASDGDILIAWALARAAHEWHSSADRQAALGIEADIRKKLIREMDGETILLPGASGFADHKKLVVNLSYWVFPALEELGRLSGQAVWQRLGTSGLRLLDRAAFGRWHLPPDWLALKPRYGIAGGFRPWFGYDAIRIPLYLIWGGDGGGRLDRFVAFWDSFAKTAAVPSWTDLLRDTVDGSDAEAGVKAIMVLVRAQAAGRKPSLAELPALQSGQSYYQASLLLLAKLAVVEAP